MCNVEHRQQVHLIMGYVAANFSFPLLLNYLIFSDSCFGEQFVVLEHFLNMMVDGSHIHIVELSHRFLGKPDILFLVTELDKIFFVADGSNIC